MDENSFWSAEKRLERAKKHIAELEAESDRFFDQNAYAQIVEPQPDGIYQLHKLRLNHPLPDTFYFLAVEAIEGLRAALDNCGYACAASADAKSAYFPFADSEAGLETVIKGRCKDIPSEIISIFRQYKPYKGANDFLWALNKLCNSAKHKSLVTAGVNIGQFGIKGSTKGHWRMPGITIDREKNEITYLESSIGAEGTIEAQFTFYISFGDVAEIERYNGARVLQFIARVVEGIIEQVKGECRRLGWLPPIRTN